MVEPQLVDYIKKARETGQSDGETRSLLYKNGWTEEEVNEAFSSVDKPEPQLQPEAQIQSEHQVSGQPEIKIQQIQPEDASKPQAPYQPQPIQEPRYQSQPMETDMPERRGGTHLILKLLIVLILLAVIGGGIYFAMGQKNLLRNLADEISSYFSPPKILPSETVEKKAESEEPTTQPSLSLTTKNIATISQEYDLTKITVVSFSEAGERAVYCAPLKINNTKISCFLNNQKILDNPYSFKPYWAGISPNGQRIIFLYYDPVGKQSFVFENGKEGARHNGILNSPNFSSDSQSFIFVLMSNDGKDFIVLNDKPGAPYDKIFTIPKLSSDGRYILYGARNGQDIFWVADEITDEEAKETIETEELTGEETEGEIEETENETE